MLEARSAAALRRVNATLASTGGRLQGGVDALIEDLSRTLGLHYEAIPTKGNGFHWSRKGLELDVGTLLHKASELLSRPTPPRSHQP